MTRIVLKYPSLRVCADLRRNVADSLDRYLEGDFAEFADSDDWAIPLQLQVDPAPLASLLKDPADDATNSLLVWEALKDLSPSVASEGRIWTRLCHVECLEYARARWMGSRKGAEAVKVIEDHFFADTRTACRDDNAVGRLWWTAHVANQAAPENLEQAVRAIWKSADIRSNIVERPWIASRPRVAAAIVQAIVHTPAVTASESAFRDFMKQINNRGGGRLFEVMSDADLEEFVKACVPPQQT